MFHSLFFCSENNPPLFSVKNEKLETEFEGQTNQVPLKVHEWHYICLRYGPTTSIYFNNETKFEATTQNYLNFGSRLRFLIGALREISFSGEIADVRFYFDVLTSTQIETLRNFQDFESAECFRLQFLCQNYASHQKQMNPKRFKVEVDSSVYVMHFDGSVSCNWANRICQSFGGELPSEQNRNAILPYIEKYSDKVVEITTFCVKGGGNSTGHEVYLEGKKGKENVTLARQDEALWRIETFLCVFVEKPQYFFSSQKKRRIPFTYKPYSKYEFEHTKGDMIISWEDDHVDSKWTLKNKNKASGELHVESPMDLIGRRDWLLFGTHANWTEVSIFSACKEDQFTCSSGACVDLSKTCNFRAECLDESDEDFCRVGIEPLHTYYKGLAPQNGTKISLEVRINRIVEVNMIQNIITLNLKLSLKWRDKRLRFKNLPIAPHRPIPVVPEVAEKYWAPHVTITPAIDDDHENLFSLNLQHGEVEALRTSGGKPSFLDGYEGDSSL